MTSNSWEQLEMRRKEPTAGGSGIRGSWVYISREMQNATRECGESRDNLERVQVPVGRMNSLQDFQIFM